MSEFQKGLLLGIMIMSSMFLFTASTKSEVDSKEKIVEYRLVVKKNTTVLNETINDIYLVDEDDKLVGKKDKGWVPFGSPVAIIVQSDNKTRIGQAMVRYGTNQ